MRRGRVLSGNWGRARMLLRIFLLVWLGVSCEFLGSVLIGLAASIRRSMRTRAVGALWDLIGAFSAHVRWVFARFYINLYK